MSDRGVMNKQLEGCAEHFNEMQRLARLGSWVWDLAEDKTVWSTGLFRIFGLEPKVLDENAYEEFISPIHPEDKGRVERVLQKAFDSKTPFDLSYRMVQPDATVVNVLSIGDVEKDASGRPVKMFGTVQDVTRQAVTEEERLMEQKLKSLGVLAGGIAHDFNNLLTAILGNISFTKHSLDIADRVYVKLLEAEKATLKARELTVQLLTFARGGAPVKELLAPQSLITGSVREALDNAEVRCEFSVPDNLLKVEADPSQINLVLSSMVANSCQAMPIGGVLRVSAENVDVGSSGVPHLHGLTHVEQGRYVKISIKDNGCGIPEDYLTKVFDPYFTTKDKAQGLGLATAYSIIKNHGGHIGVESRPGAGATFHIYLPAAGVQEAKGPAKQGVYVSGKGKVLIMDDEDIIRELAGEFLGNLGYEVEFAKDGTEALEVYSRSKNNGKPVDVVIMDLVIPGGMGGKECIKKLLEIDPKARVIVSSGYSSDPVMSNFKKYGFCDVIAKPYKITELNGVVQKVLKKAGA